jgi:hypothetical protein
MRNSICVLKNKYGECYYLYPPQDLTTTLEQGRQLALQELDRCGGKATPRPQHPEMQIAVTAFRNKVEAERYIEEYRLPGETWWPVKVKTAEFLLACIESNVPYVLLLRPENGGWLYNAIFPVEAVGK